jgi:hypothetical protein
VHELLTLGAEVVPYDFNGAGWAGFVAVGYDDGSWYQHDDETPFFVPSSDGLSLAGDYDGDGRWEPAAVDGATWETGGGRGTFTFDPWSMAPPPAGDVEYVPADYDGDFVTEPAVYSSADARWYIEGESAPIEFGTPASSYPAEYQEVALPADYDGDGQAELAVYRPTDGTVHVRGMGQVAELPLGFPAAADFDGDGTDEAAVYNAVEQRWYFADGTTLDSGILDDYSAWPVPADTDGDGVAEPWVFSEWTDSFSRPGETIPAANGLVDVHLPAALPSGLLWSIVRLTFLQQCTADPFCGA